MMDASRPQSERAFHGREHERRIQTICLLVLTFIAVGVALYFLRPVLIPFVLAIIFVYCLSPIVEIQMHYLRLRRGIAIFNTIVIGCATLVALWLLIGQSVVAMSQSAGDYEEALVEFMDNVEARLPLTALGIDPGERDLLHTIRDESARRFLPQLITSIRGLLSNGLLIVIFMIFMIAGRHQAPREGPTLRRRIEGHIKRYLITKVLLSAITGTLVGVVLSLLGVQMAFVFGMLAFLLNFIPSIGSVIATLLPIPIIYLDPSLAVSAKIAAVVIPGVLQFVIGSIIEPRVMGGSLGLHPVVILLGLIFFGMIWGIIGMFLATPIVAVTKIVLERSELTAPIAAWLSGRLEAMPMSSERPS